MKAPPTGERSFPLFFWIGAAVFVASILWLNFNGAQWYHFDMYADVQVALRMAEQNTLFPANWVFGNQYYVIATPAVAALFCKLCGDGMLSMSLASSLMTLLILGAFLWCCAPFYSRRSLAVGLFCLSGAVILGNSASSCTTGLQLLYTMASYYACYLLGILFHLGLYLRLRTGKKVHPLLWVLALGMDLALGMQSPRETVVLNLPLLLLEIYAVLSLGKNKKSGAFVLAAFAANLAGLGLIRLLPVHSSVIYAPPAFDLRIPSLLSNLKGTAGALLGMMGIPYLNQGWKWKVLGLLALFFCAAVLAALILLLRRREKGPRGLLPLFCGLSILSVFGVGVLLFRVRDIYFFVWILLVCVCFMSLSELLPEGRLRALLLTALLLAGLASYVYEFYPDFKKYPEQKRFYAQAVQLLEEQGVDRIYVDFITYPTVAACSGGRIDAGTFWYAFDAEDGALLTPVPHLKPLDLFETIQPERSMIVLSDSAFGDLSSLDYVRLLGPEGYAEALMARLEPAGVLDDEYQTLYFYRFEDPELIR